jgi:hypothetical protein
VIGELLQNARSDHERYVGEHVAAYLHAIDLSAGPPPPMQKVTTFDT